MLGHSGRQGSKKARKRTERWKEGKGQQKRPAALSQPAAIGAAAASISKPSIASKQPSCSKAASVTGQQPASSQQVGSSRTNKPAIGIFAIRLYKS